MKMPYLCEYGLFFMINGSKCVLSCEFCGLQAGVCTCRPVVLFYVLGMGCSASVSKLYLQMGESDVYEVWELNVVHLRTGCGLVMESGSGGSQMNCRKVCVSAGMQSCTAVCGAVENDGLFMKVMELKEVLRMRIACYSAESDMGLLVENLKRAEGDAELHYFSKFSDFDWALHICAYDVIVVNRRGSSGMEAVKTVRAMNPMIPVVWITDEPEYGPVSYTMQTAMALLMPASEEQLREALHRCAEWKAAQEMYGKNRMDMC